MTGSLATACGRAAVTRRSAPHAKRQPRNLTSMSHGREPESDDRLGSTELDSLFKARAPIRGISGGGILR